MTIGERIKEIRMHADNGNKLTLEKFGNRISLTNQAISAMESGRANPSNATIDLICREFNVNKEWLVDGVGEPYHLPLDEDAELFAEVVKLGEGRATVESIKAVLKMYLSLDESGRRTLDKLITDAVERTKKDPEE